MAFIARLQRIFREPQFAVKLLLGGFIGFIVFGCLIYLAESLQSEWLAAVAIGLMICFGLVAMIGYLGVWYHRLFAKKSP